MNAITTYQTPKTAVAIRREMAQIPAVMGVLEPVERAVFLASTAKTFDEYDGAELAMELKPALKFIARDTGYRSTDENEMSYLIIRVAEILKRYYGGMTIKDFRMAFEMSITGALDDYLPKGRNGEPDRGHYQQFNVDYVCKILNAYKARRAAVLRKASEAMPEPERERDFEMEKYYRNNTKKELIDAFESYKETGVFPSLSPIAEMLYYDLLASAGLADEIVVTLDEQKAILQRTINEYARKGYVGDMRRLQQAGPDAPELQHGAFSLTRKKELKKAFARMRDNGIDLLDYIEFE